MDWNAYKKERQQERAENRQEAAGGFEEAAQLASRHNLVLTQCSEHHYQLRAFEDGRVCWLYNLYPGNQRIWSDRKYRGPYLELPPCDWTLMDIVRAVAREQERMD